MLQVGMKAIIIGAMTEEGRRWVGSEVVVHQLLSEGVILDPTLLLLPQELSDILGAGWSCAWDKEEAVVIYREGMTSAGGLMKDGYAIFKRSHVMPIQPLEDPGIDECTFTPIVQKETA